MNFCKSLWRRTSAKFCNFLTYTSLQIFTLLGKKKDAYCLDDGQPLTSNRRHFFYQSNERNSIVFVCKSLNFAVSLAFMICFKLPCPDIRGHLLARAQKPSHTQPHNFPSLSSFYPLTYNIHAPFCLYSHPHHSSTCSLTLSFSPCDSGQK